MTGSYTAWAAPRPRSFEPLGRERMVPLNSACQPVSADQVARRHTSPKRPLSLLLPCLPGQKTQVVEADRRCFAAAGQALQHLWRQIGEAQLAADVALGETDGLGQFLDRGELACLHAPPPAPCTADGA